LITIIRDLSGGRLPDHADASGVELGVARAIDVTSGPGVPQSIVATATAATSVTVNWSAAVGSSSYDVDRSASGTSFVKIGSTTGLTYTDTLAVANTSYLYALTAEDSSTNASLLSPADLAPTVLFTDPTLTAGVTMIKTVHLNQLRTAVKAVRVLAGLGAATFTDPTLTAGVTQPRAVHVTELRSALAAGRSALALTAVRVTDAGLTALPVKAVHLLELRGGVQSRCS
jgi:hypothetical protein